VTIDQFDVYEETGMYEDDFEALHQELKVGLSQSRSGRPIQSQTVLTSRVRLLMVLHWLREKPKFRVLAQKFDVSPSVVHRDIVWLLPKLVVATRKHINWPDNPLFGFEDTIGSIDCTAHPRTRVHPRQADFYRRDKGINDFGPF
jgi:hypothetical protein